MKNLLNWSIGLLVLILMMSMLRAENYGNNDTKKSDGERSSTAFYKYDADRDGFISREEAAKMKLRGRSFDDVDTDRDGKLSANEFEQYYVVSAGMDKEDKPDRSMRQAIVDAWLTAKVKSALLADEQVKALRINVDTLKGTVTLKGEADSSTQISQAGKVAAEVKGVQSVNNQLMVKLDTQNGTAEHIEDKQNTKLNSTLSNAKQFSNDSAITGKVKAALLADEQVKGSQVSVETDKGIVTLKGMVSSSDQAIKAARIASNIEGVTSVQNDLTVKK
jgi:hyperosmotically inducible protein